MGTRWIAISPSLCSVLLSAPAPMQAQGPQGGAQLDHVALHVQDLQRSADFYGQVLQLEKIGEPFKDGRHVWFRLGPRAQLHLIASASKAAADDIDVHFAVRVASLQAFLSHLENRGVKCFSTRREPGLVTVRPDGVKQVYLQDPDGYWIEVNDSQL